MPRHAASVAVGEADDSVEGLVSEFMAAGKQVASQPEADQTVVFPGPPDKPNWYQVLMVTDERNPLLEDQCRKHALESSVDTLKIEKGIADEAEALRVAADHMSRHQRFIRENQISYSDYLQRIAECRSFCAPLIAHLVQCHILSVARSIHGIVLFDRGSDLVDPLYEEGIVASLARELNAQPESKLVLIGRASRIGDLLYNRRLSARRALAVKDRLVAQGVVSRRIETMWLGWEPPQISASIADEYGFQDLFDHEGEQRINQSVMAVVY